MTPISAPWWQQLPENYGQITTHYTHVDARYPLQIKGTAAMDLALRTVVASMVLLAMAPNLVRPSHMRRDLERLEFYGELADRADPAEVFLEPPRNVAVQRKELPRIAYHPKNIPAELLTFTSPYLALNPAIREDYAQHQHNQQVYAQYWPHPSGPRPTLIFIHGFIADWYGFNSEMFSLRWFYKQGYDILLYTLPFHGYRQGRFHPYSGFGYMAYGFSHINEAMLQAVYDLRIIMNYLESRGVPHMGLSGLSLGGYITALTACADARPAFAIPNAPPVLPVDMISEWMPLSLAYHYQLQKLGMTLADARRLAAIHCPLTYAPLLEARRLLVIGGAGDRFTAPHYVKLLHEHWKGSAIHWFPGNHILHLHQGEYLKLMWRFMDRCCELE